MGEPKINQLKLNQLELIRQENYNCTKCSSRSKCKEVKVGWGSLTASVVVVGDQPNYFEGLRLNLIDQIIPIGRSNLYFTYLSKCPGTSKANIDICKDWLHKELDEIKPKVVISMGKLSTNVLTGKLFSSPAKPYTAHPVSLVDASFTLGESFTILSTYAPNYLLNHLGEIEKTKKFLSNLRDYL